MGRVVAGLVVADLALVEVTAEGTVVGTIVVGTVGGAVMLTGPLVELETLDGRLRSSEARSSDPQPRGRSKTTQHIIPTTLRVSFIS